MQVKIYRIQNQYGCGPFSGSGCDCRQPHPIHDHDAFSIPEPDDDGLDGWNPSHRFAFPFNSSMTQYFHKACFNNPYNAKDKWYVCIFLIDQEKVIVSTSQVQCVFDPADAILYRQFPAKEYFIE